MKKIIFLTVALTLMVFTDGRAQLVINEMMQSNVDCIMDNLNDFPDSWVELYNTGDKVVNTNEYKIGITDADSAAWQLPNFIVGAHGYVLVYCDKASTGFHTGFRLDSGKGCQVFLFRNGAKADAVTIKSKQPSPNIAYGRLTDASDTWGYQNVPTPGAVNCGSVCKDILGTPVFSEKGRVMTGSKAISLALSMPEGSPAATQIRYTYDGSEPTKSSSLYTVPLTISTTRVVRAKPFCDGYLSPRSVAQSYIFFPRKLTLPVISIITDNSYFYDSKIGIYVDGNYQTDKKNYEFDWRRPINMEFFEGEDTVSTINQLCETRIMGAASRGAKMKSLAVYADKRFGTKRLNCEFFPDQRPGISEYKSIMLRNAGNDFDYLYMRDAVIQRTVAQRADLDWQAWRPAIIYINGTYNGMLNIRERSNEDNIYTNYDGLEDIDMIENWNELKTGDMKKYNEFKAFYNEHGHTMAEYEKLMDCNEYINLMLTNLYYNNLDFPGNNFVMWRPRTDNGRWRFVIKDADFGLGLYGSPATYKTFQWLYNPNFDSDHAWANSYEQTRLFRRLMEDTTFARTFIDHAAVYMGDFLNEKGTRDVWDPMYETVKYEYPYHRQLINQWWPNYNDELTSARNWLSARTASFYLQMADYYSLGTPTVMTVNKSLGTDELNVMKTSFNGVILSKGIFDGKFFANRSVTLVGTAVEGKAVTGWKIVKVSYNGTVSNDEMKGDTYSFSMPACASLNINAVLGDASAIVSTAAPSWKWRVDGGHILLSGVAARTRVCLYDAQGMLCYQTIADGGDIQLPANRQLYILKVGADVVKIVE
jgi:hypothetical protein